jgi:hypothetical protein
MPDDTAAETPSSDLLDDLGITDLLGGTDAVDSDDDDDDDDDDDGTPSVVYDDVDADELFTIDPETGDQQDLDPSQVSDSSEIQVVDDPEDGSGDDEVGDGDGDGLDLDDPAVSTSADDLSTDGDADYMDDV